LRRSIPSAIACAAACGGFARCDHRGPRLKTCSAAGFRLARSIIAVSMYPNGAAAANAAGNGGRMPDALLTIRLD
jgi:hypothetical protein